MALAEGDLAPDFELPTDGGGTVKLSDLRGKKVVLFFYPKDDTPGCTVESIDFTSAVGDFEAAGAVIVGISPDDVDSHDKFKAKHDLKVILGADTDKSVIEAYGAWGEKMNYGKTTVGLIRTTVLVDEDGKVAQVWPNVRVKGHVDKVLAAVKSD